MKTIALKTKDERYNAAARFWAKVFGINFVIGVVTGIPMEFQFGTNWSQFSRLTGGVIGQPLVMEGVFAFFLESAFLGLFLFGEKRLSPKMHWFSGFMVALGSWISGYFIIVTNAWMQHPVAYTRAADGSFQVNSFWGLLLNPWAWVEYSHNMSGAMVTGTFFMSAIGAFYVLSRRDVEYGRLFLKVGIITGLCFSVVQLFPTGDLHGKMLARTQPATMAAMEALWTTQPGAPMVILGQPDVEQKKIDNPLAVNKVLSFLVYGTTSAEVKGLDSVPPDQWPTNIELLYYSYHVMVGLGTMFIAVMLLAALLMWRRKLYDTRWALWIVMLSLPFPYIANTAGWMTAELGRQPWLVYGLMRTAHGFSSNVSAGNGWFTLLGFMGMYTVLSILFLFLIYRVIAEGPGQPPLSLPKHSPLTAPEFAEAGRD